MQERDAYFMGLALEQARAAQEKGEVPVGAVVVADGRVVGLGHNRVISDHDPSAHAEVVALREAARTLRNYRLDACELYVTLEPCPMCWGAVQHARIRRLVYGANDSHGTQPTPPGRCETQGQCLADECATLLRGFFQERRSEQAQEREALRDDAVRSDARERERLGADLWPAQGHYIRPPLQTLQGLRLHVWQVVQHPPASSLVLCLHGHASWALQFRPLLRSPSLRTHDWLLVDRPGHGWSDKSKKGWEHAPEIQVAALVELLQRQGHARVALVAHDGAAPLAWVLAQRDPRVCSVSLLHPCLYGEMLPYRHGTGQGEGAGLQDWTRITTLAGWKRWALQQPGLGADDARLLGDVWPLPLPDDGHVVGWSRYLRHARGEGGAALDTHLPPFGGPVHILCNAQTAAHAHGFCVQYGIPRTAPTLEVLPTTGSVVAHLADHPFWV